MSLASCKWAWFGRETDVEQQVRNMDCPRSENFGLKKDPLSVGFHREDL